MFLKSCDSTSRLLGGYREGKFRKRIQAQSKSIEPGVFKEISPFIPLFCLQFCLLRGPDALILYLVTLSHSTVKPAPSLTTLRPTFPIYSPTLLIMIVVCFPSLCQDELANNPPSLILCKIDSDLCSMVVNKKLLGSVCQTLSYDHADGTVT